MAAARLPRADRDIEIPSSRTPLRKASDKESGGDTDSSVDGRLPPRRMRWLDSVFVMNASVIGMGILSIPHAFAVLGLIPGIGVCALCALLNVLMARMMVEVQVVYPRAITLADASSRVLGGSRAAKHAVRWCVYGERFLSICAGVLLLGRTIGQVTPSLHLCQGPWSLVGILSILPFTHVGLLSSTWYNNAVNFGSICAAIVILIGALYGGHVGSRELPAHGHPSVSMWVPATTSVPQIFGATADIVFSFQGNWMYYEIMSELDCAVEFSKAAIVGVPMQFGLYILIGCVGYTTLGAHVPEVVIEALPFGFTSRAVAVLLVVHLICGSVVNNTVLVRFLQSKGSPETLNDSKGWGALVRVGISLCLFFFSWLIANAVPSFEFLVSLMGALVEAPIMLIVPVWHFYLTRRRNPEALAWTPWWWTAGGLVAVAFALAVMVFGVANCVQRMARLESRPMQCNCKGVWDVCECSASRLPADACIAHAGLL